MIYEQYRVRDICDIRSGKRLPLGMELSPIETPYKYIRARDIKNGKISLADVAYIDEATKQKIKKYIIETGDIAITIVANIGDVGYCSEECNQANLTENAVRLTNFNKDIVNSEFLTYYLSQTSLKKYMEGLAVGAAQAKLGIYKIQKMKLSLPKLQVQNRIVEILSIYDELIENNNNRIKLLEQMGENLYKEWFVRLRFPMYESFAFENGFPRGFEYKTVDQLSDILQRGISPTYDDNGKYYVISQKCIRKNIMDISEARKQSKEFKSILNLKDGDTVICSTGTGTLGRVGQVYGDYPDTTFDSHVTLVRAKNNIGKHFLFYSLKNLQPWFMNMGIGSTNQQELYKKTIQKAKILVPDTTLMNSFEEYIEQIHKQIIALSKANDNLIKQRDLLLPRLMSGKLEV